MPALDNRKEKKILHFFVNEKPSIMPGCPVALDNAQQQVLVRKNIQVPTVVCIKHESFHYDHLIFLTD